MELEEEAGLQNMTLKRWPQIECYNHFWQEEQRNKECLDTTDVIEGLFRNVMKIKITGWDDDYISRCGRKRGFHYSNKIEM